MATKICSLWVVNQHGSSSHHVGRDYYGLVLDRIEDQSREFPDSHVCIYRGFTDSGDTVFEVINAPIEVAYEPEDRQK